MASFVVGQFEDVISKIVMLAVLMPIVASMGGNAGHQTLAITIRALALKELTKANMLRIVSKEFFVGALNGMIFALLIGTITWFWYQDASLTLVIALAMTLNLLSAGLAGILIPLIMEKLKIDPALSSSVFVTAITDMGGFFIFLGLAKVLMFS
jgi:magnesium transporter